MSVSICLSVAEGPFTVNSKKKQASPAVLKKQAASACRKGSQ